MTPDSAIAMLERAVAGLRNLRSLTRPLPPRPFRKAREALVLSGFAVDGGLGVPSPDPAQSDAIARLRETVAAALESIPKPPETVVVAAVDDDLGLGRDGRLAFRHVQDMRRFRALTEGHTLVMGRLTFAEIGRPLPGRRTIVVGSRPAPDMQGLARAPDVPGALHSACRAGARRVFLCGGAGIYMQGLPLADRIELTRVAGTHGCDVFFPSWPQERWRLALRRSGHGLPPELAFETWLPVADDDGPARS